MIQAIKAALGMQSLAEKVYLEAYHTIGFDASPRDVAPDELGCMESVSDILEKAGVPFPYLVSTRDGETEFDRSMYFEEIDKAEPYCIILSVTGSGNGSIVGHVGIVGRYTAPDGSLWVMSNDSRAGVWLVNFTVNTWFDRYVGKGELRTKFYRIV